MRNLARNVLRGKARDRKHGRGRKVNMTGNRKLC